MGILKGLKAINEREAALEAEAMAKYDEEGWELTIPEVAEYLDAIQRVGITGEWHVQQLGLEDEGDEPFVGPLDWVVLLVNPDNELVEIIGRDETPYKSWIDAEWTVQEGDYPFTWEELMESTQRHTDEWSEVWRERLPDLVAKRDAEEAAREAEIERLKREGRLHSAEDGW